MNRTAATLVLLTILAVGAFLNALGHATRGRWPTLGDVARTIHRHRWGGWVLFLTWALVGWHLLA